MFSFLSSLSFYFSVSLINKLLRKKSNYIHPLWLQIYYFLTVYISRILIAIFSQWNLSFSFIDLGKPSFIYLIYIIIFTHYYEFYIFTYKIYILHIYFFSLVHFVNRFISPQVFFYLVFAWGNVSLWFAIVVLCYIFPMSCIYTI